MNTVNGNPRYVFHFRDILSDKEYRKCSSVGNAYDYAVSKAKKLGDCKKYRAKWYVGGIVICTYNLQEFINEVNTTL